MYSIAGLKVEEKTFLSLPEWNPNSSAVQPVALVILAF
jgi:hypothetical protein